MEKVLINQDPSCTIEPDTGAFEMPDMRRYVVAKVLVVPSKNAPDARWMCEFCPGVNARDCTDHQTPADAAASESRAASQAHTENRCVQVKPAWAPPSK